MEADQKNSNRLAGFFRYGRKTMLREAADGLGKRLRMKRIELGVTQTQLAELLNTSQMLISLWERGRQFPRKKCLSSICKILDLKPAILKVAEKLRVVEKAKTKRGTPSIENEVIGFVNELKSKNQGRPTRRLKRRTPRSSTSASGIPMEEERNDKES